MKCHLIVSMLVAIGLTGFTVRAYGQQEIQAKSQSAPALTALADGTVELRYPDGLLKRVAPDGILSVIQPDGTKAVSLPENIQTAMGALRNPREREIWLGAPYEIGYLVDQGTGASFTVGDLIPSDRPSRVPLSQIVAHTVEPVPPAIAPRDPDTQRFIQDYRMWIQREDGWLAQHSDDLLKIIRAKWGEFGVKEYQAFAKSRLPVSAIRDPVRVEIDIRTEFIERKNAQKEIR